MAEPEESGELKVVLLPVNPTDRQLMATMTRKDAPRWMRVAACVALEGRKTVLVTDGLPVIDRCEACGAHGLFIVRAFHKNRLGGDTRALENCDACGALAEGRPLTALEDREENPTKAIKAFRSAF